MKFSELVRLLEPNGFRIIKEKGSIRYYGCQVWTGSSESIIMVRKKIPMGTCNAILKAAGLK